MCNYWHGGTLECRGDGYMWDADADGYDPEDHSMPCPACNTATWLLDAKEHGEAVSYSSGMGGSATGVEAWQGAVQTAMAANPQLTPKLLRRIGIVRPIEDAVGEPGGFREQRFDYRNTRYLVSRKQREGRGRAAGMRHDA
jgi:hypothetical protein